MFNLIWSQGHILYANGCRFPQFSINARFHFWNFTLSPLIFNNRFGVVEDLTLGNVFQGFEGVFFYIVLPIQPAQQVQNVTDYKFQMCLYSLSACLLLIMHVVFWGGKKTGLKRKGWYIIQIQAVSDFCTPASLVFFSLSIFLEINENVCHVIDKLHIRPSWRI